MTPSEWDTLSSAYMIGPLFDGDLINVTNRDSLVHDGYMCRFFVKDDGFNAVTQKGTIAYKIIEAMRKSNVT